MQFILTLTAFIYGSEKTPHEQQYPMASYEECLKSSQAIYEGFAADSTIHEVAVECVAHRDADQPVEKRDG